MNTYLRIFWLFALTMFTAGCSGFQTACYTSAEDPGMVEGTPWEDCGLRPGEKIRITTLNGSRVVGQVDRVSPDWVVIQPDITGSLPRLFSPTQILSIEKSTASAPEPLEMDQTVIGDEVCLYLIDGSHVQGKVLEVSEQKIVLDPEGDSSRSFSYPTEQIEWMTAKKGGGNSWVAPVVGILVVGLVVGGIMVANSGLSEPIQLFSD